MKYIYPLAFLALLAGCGEGMVTSNGPDRPEGGTIKTVNRYKAAFSSGRSTVTYENGDFKQVIFEGKGFPDFVWRDEKTLLVSSSSIAKNVMEMTYGEPGRPFKLIVTEYADMPVSTLLSQGHKEAKVSLKITPIAKDSRFPGRKSVVSHAWITVNRVDVLDEESVYKDLTNVTGLTLTGGPGTYELSIFWTKNGKDLVRKVWFNSEEVLKVPNFRNQASENKAESQTN